MGREKHFWAVHLNFPRIYVDVSTGYRGILSRCADIVSRSYRPCARWRIFRLRYQLRVPCPLHGRDVPKKIRFGAAHC